ncbi:MAG: hypothetical protein MUF39_00185 [Cyclobacteriaceae bacterium]|jgi:hypothetical protein|nr:hypothetical protein [Cyclobacteriaceae bacterium]
MKHQALNKNHRAEELKVKIQKASGAFIYDAEDEPSDEYAHFYFLGNHEGREVVYDAVLYTLRLQHESELFEIAEHKAAEQFPEYKKIQYEEDENGNLKPLDDLEERIGLYMAEVMMELEEEGSVKVKEHVDIDLNNEVGVGLDIGLNIDKLSPKIIESFIHDFNRDQLKLDDTLYTFETQTPDNKD